MAISLHTVAETAAILRLSKGTVYKLIRLGLLRAEKVGERGIRVTDTAIEAYLAAPREPEATERPPLRLVHDASAVA